MNILFTGFYFENFHGSMLQICEMARYLTARGHTCFCASVEISDPIRLYALKNGLRLYHVYELPRDLQYDIVIAYHFPVLPYLIANGLRYKNVVCGCLSSHAHLESLPEFHEKCNFISVVSGEVKHLLIDKYKLDGKRIRILRNCIPDEFINFPYSAHEEIQKIAVVSNHQTYELQSLDKAFPSSIEVDFWGRNAKNYAPITPEILSRYSLIVTIGKTVQYAMGMGIPVYNYDRFGGSGYITPNNYLKEEYYNYSGRSFNRKLSSKKIAHEIRSGYKDALLNSHHLKSIAKERYLLSSNIDLLIKDIQSCDAVRIDRESHKLFFEYSIFIVEEATDLWNKLTAALCVRSI